jgi:hypothetical protein
MCKKVWRCHGWKWTRLLCWNKTGCRVDRSPITAVEKSSALYKIRLLILLPSRSQTSHFSALCRSNDFNDILWRKTNSVGLNLHGVRYRSFSIGGQLRSMGQNPNRGYIIVQEIVIEERKYAIKRIQYDLMSCHSKCIEYSDTHS